MVTEVSQNGTNFIRRDKGKLMVLLSQTRLRKDGISWQYT